MEKTNASKQGVLHWLDENFEKMFLVTGLLSITLFITSSFAVNSRMLQQIPTMLDKMP